MKNDREQAKLLQRKPCAVFLAHPVCTAPDDYIYAW